MECSEVSKAEIKAFHQRRLSEFRQALLYYVEVSEECWRILSFYNFIIQGQVKCYRDNQSALTNCLNKMKDFKLPEVKDSMFDPNDNDK